jgi:hypothetical protein
MKIKDFILEANVARKIEKDPKTVKRLGIAIRHDKSFPPGIKAKLGHSPNDLELLNAWSELLDRTLSNTDYGDLSSEGKYDEWLTRLYLNGINDYEDINGEGGQALGMYQALSRSGQLLPQDQDFNRFTSLTRLYQRMRIPQYRSALERIKNQATIEKHKKTQLNTVVLDNDRFYAMIPFNYGACYTFNNAVGYQANFCTGSSSGLNWFNRYAPDGMLVCVIDKENLNEPNGKWQIHAGTNQFVNADQDNRWNPSGNAEKFGKMFPGLMKQIVQGIKQHSEEIHKNSQEITRGGYDVNKQIQDLLDNFPKAFTDVVSNKPGSDNNQAELL